jgi:uncharacterized protein (DUF58 family)
MLTSELIRRIRFIEIRTRRLVNDLFAGEYQSVFKGRGMEFAEVREYQPGDDVRSIDWNVTARMGRPFVKRFAEERELTVMLVVDASRSQAFGSAGRSKAETAAELCGLLAFSAIQNHDKVGLILFTDHVEKFVPPKKGRQHVLRVIRELLGFEPAGRGTCIAEALGFLSRVVRRRSVVFLVSDFFDDDYRRALQVTNRRHDVIAITLSDRRERELPAVGLLALEDAETGRLRYVDTSQAAFRAAYTAGFQQHQAQRDAALAAAKVDRVDIRSEASYVEPLIAFFKARQRRLQV